jgi:hypothetical protein
MCASDPKADMDDMDIVKSNYATSLSGIAALRNVPVFLLSAIVPGPASTTAKPRSSSR